MKLENGQLFPQVTALINPETSFTLPDDLTAEWSTLLFYRGHF